MRRAILCQVSHNNVLPPPTNEGGLADFGYSTVSGGELQMKDLERTGRGVAKI